MTFDWNSRCTGCAGGFSVYDSTAAVLDINIFGMLFVFENGVACVVCLVYGLRCPIGCDGSGGNVGIT